jgi:hypothetical protein
MQIPAWLFAITLLFALTLKDMSTSIFAARGGILKAALSPAIQSFNFTSRLPRSAFFNSINRFNTQTGTRPFSHTTSIMSAKSAIANPESAVKVTSATPFLEAIQSRRSLYALNKSPTISDARIQEIIKHALLHVPSSFNAQSSRIVLLLKDDHDKLWNGLVHDSLKALLPADQFAPTEQKIKGFAAAYGTVCLFSLPFSS